jgi:hypothetical protein
MLQFNFFKDWLLGDRHGWDWWTKTIKRDEPVQSGTRSRVLRFEMDFGNLENVLFKNWDQDFENIVLTIINDHQVVEYKTKVLLGTLSFKVRLIFMDVWYEQQLTVLLAWKKLCSASVYLFIDVNDWVETV